MCTAMSISGGVKPLFVLRLQDFRMGFSQIPPEGARPFRSSQHLLRRNHISPSRRDFVRERNQAHLMTPIMRVKEHFTAVGTGDLEIPYGCTHSGRDFVGAVLHLGVMPVVIVGIGCGKGSQTHNP
jgi:hypothetical protein